MLSKNFLFLLFSSSFVPCVSSISFLLVLCASSSSLINLEIVSVLWELPTADNSFFIFLSILGCLKVPYWLFTVVINSFSVKFLHSHQNEKVLHFPDFHQSLILVYFWIVLKFSNNYSYISFFYSIAKVKYIVSNKSQQEIFFIFAVIVPDRLKEGLNDLGIIIPYVKLSEWLPDNSISRGFVKTTPYN